VPAAVRLPASESTAGVTEGPPTAAWMAGISSTQKSPSASLVTPCSTTSQASEPTSRLSASVRSYWRSAGDEVLVEGLVGHRVRGAAHEEGDVAARVGAAVSLGAPAGADPLEVGLDPALPVRPLAVLVAHRVARVGVDRAVLDHPAQRRVGDDVPQRARLDLGDRLLGHPDVRDHAVGPGGARRGERREGDDGGDREQGALHRRRCSHATAAVVSAAGALPPSNPDTRSAPPPCH
jgi:hypothetical protein